MLTNWSYKVAPYLSVTTDQIESDTLAHMSGIIRAMYESGPKPFYIQINKPGGNA